jgi:cold shock CspA family protein
MLEVGLWLQGCIVWQLVLIEATLPIVKYMEIMMKSMPKASEAESIGSVFYMSDNEPISLRPLPSRHLPEGINDKEVRTMPYGTVRWFNTKTGSGFIRTDDGENVLFLNGAIRDSNPSSIYRGTRVYLDVLKSKYGLTGINVKVTELPEGCG